MRILILVSAVLATLPVCAEEATYLLSGGDIPVAAASNGYVQHVRELPDGQYEAHVAAVLAPIDGFDRLDARRQVFDCRDQALVPWVDHRQTRGFSLRNGVTT